MAEVRSDSGAWKAGERLGIMEGVRTRTEAFGVDVGVWLCEYVGGEVNRGRKACVVRIGLRRRLLIRS